MTELVRMPVDGPFSLAAAAAFGFGPNTGRPLPGDGAAMRLVFVTDDLRHQAGAAIRQEPGGGLVADVHGSADVAAVERQLRRILSVDRPADGWIAAGRRDPVLGRLQADHPGLRPVLFHSPYEAAAWAMMSQRRQRNQAAAMRRRVCEALGRPFELDGQVDYAFPLPDRLLGLETFPGLEPRRVERLRGVAERALAGDLDPEMLASMETDRAMAALEAIPGLGPFYARSGPAPRLRRQRRTHQRGTTAARLPAPLLRAAGRARRCGGAPDRRGMAPVPNLGRGADPCVR